MKLKIPLALLLLVTFVGTVQAKSCKLNKPLRVAVIDTGLNLTDPRFKNHLCKSGHKDFTGTGLNDTNGHGTFVTGLIEQYAKKSDYCLLIYKYYGDNSSPSVDLDNELLALQAAIDNKADIVNFSGGGEGFNEQESLLIKYNPDTTFVVAAGNNGLNLDLPNNEYYPASYFYVNEIVVESTDSQGQLSTFSNYSIKIDDKELGENVLSYLPNGKTGYESGTSFSCAIVTGKLVAKTKKQCNSEK
jgi:subtilisin family serine protease